MPLKADCMVLSNRTSRKIKNLIVFFRMQNGRETQDDRQSIKCSRYVKTAPKNFKKYHKQLFLEKIQNGRTIQDVATHYFFGFSLKLFDFSTDQKNKIHFGFVI
jgi:hypothetical protein